MHTDIHALSGIRTHDPSLRAKEDSSCLRPRGHCDRQSKTSPTLKSRISRLLLRCCRCHLHSPIQRVLILNYVWRTYLISVVLVNTSHVPFPLLRHEQRTHLCPWFSSRKQTLVPKIMHYNIMSDCILFFL
jgi:hypothetical protein